MRHAIKRLVSWSFLPGLLLAVLSWAHGSVSAMEEKPWPPEDVLQYSLALEALEKRDKDEGLSVERVFDMGMKASMALLRGGRMEGFTPEEYEEIRSLMQGFRLNREEILFAQPEPAFFLKLSLERGQRHDVAFFETYIRTYPAGVLPVYMQMVTDYSACTLYGEKHMVNLYGQWKDYIKDNPGKYSRHAERELSEVSDFLAKRTCACDGSETVLRELDAFIKIYPEDEISPSVKKRAEEIRSGKSEFRFFCSPT